MTEREAELHDRIQKALDIAYGAQYDGESHKMWVIDQMVRALTGCPTVMKTGLNGLYNSEMYYYQTQGENDEYCRFTAGIQEWDEGIAP